MKQSTKQQNTTTTTVKNPNWPEANQLAIYKCSWDFEPGTTRNKFIEWSERVLNPGSPDLKASALTTGPHCLHWATLPHGQTTAPPAASFSVIRKCSSKFDCLIHEMFYIKELKPSVRLCQEKTIYLEFTLIVSVLLYILFYCSCTISYASSD